jgi:predicted nucleic acid-binding protein
MTWPEIREVLVTIRATCQAVPLSVATHQRGAVFAERDCVSFHDASMIAAALLTGCTHLYSDELRDG